MQERDVFDFTVGIAGRKAKHRLMAHIGGR
jgi:hypothetical protein